MEISRLRIFLLMATGVNAALFLPVMGRGFIHDDFIHLYSVAYHSLRQGLTCANGGPFYTPIAWLTFKLDWLLWGKNAFLMAAGNLLLHIANITLLRAFALKLWRSQIAARWAALGFALLFPANTWAVMWISTRAHLLVTFFYLAALIATIRLARAEGRRNWVIAAIVLFATLSIFSKESGVTSPVAIAAMLIYVRRSEGGKILSLATIIALFGSLAASLTVYAVLRARSEAIPITFSTRGWYSYAASLNVLFENLFRYGWRTYGLLGIMALAIALSQVIRGRHPRLDSFTMSSAWLSVSLFGITIAPFILLRGRSGIYTYLPGVAAAMLLGATARSCYEAPPNRIGESWRAPRINEDREENQRGPGFPHSSRSSLPRGLNIYLSAIPIFLVIALYSLLTVVHSLRWKRMAEINTFVLNRIAEYKIEPQPNTWFILTYSEADNVHGFPDSMAHGFSCALRLLYENPTLNGSIASQAESRRTKLQAPFIRLAYIHGGDGSPRLVISSGESLVY
jgi:hypothetical protein